VKSKDTISPQMTKQDQRNINCSLIFIAKSKTSWATTQLIQDGARLPEEHVLRDATNLPESQRNPPRNSLRKRSKTGTRLLAKRRHTANNPPRGEREP